MPENYDSSITCTDELCTPNLHTHSEYELKSKESPPLGISPPDVPTYSDTLSGSASSHGSCPKQQDATRPKNPVRRSLVSSYESLTEQDNDALQFGESTQQRIDSPDLPSQSGGTSTEDEDTIGDELRQDTQPEVNTPSSPLTSTPLICESDSRQSATDSLYKLTGHQAAERVAADAEFLENTFKDEDLIVSISEQPEAPASGVIDNNTLETRGRLEHEISNQKTTVADTMSSKKSVDHTARVLTTVFGQDVVIDWHAQRLLIHGIEVKFKNSNIRYIWFIKESNESSMIKGWRVLLQLRTYSVWTVTLCLPHDDCTTDILRRLSSALNYKEFVRSPSMANGAPMQKISNLERPHVGQLALDFDLQSCLQHSLCQSVPREFAPDLSKLFRFRAPQPWILKFCCADPQRQEALAIDLPECQEREKMSPHSSLVADDHHALRSLLLVASPFGCKKFQLQLSARVVAQFTGNDESFAEFGYYDSYEGKVFTDYINGKRPGNVKPISGYTDSVLEPIFIDEDTPVPPSGRVDWASIRTEDLKCRVAKMSGFFQNALRGLSYQMHEVPAPNESPMAKLNLENSPFYRCPPNPAELVNNPSMDVKDPESHKYLMQFRFPRVPTGGIRSILGVNLGRARAMMSLMERGTAHHALILHTNNIKLALVELMGFDKSAIYRFSIPAAAIIMITLSLEGLPNMILGDAGATLTEVAKTLTFSPLVEDDHAAQESQSCRSKLSSADMTKTPCPGRPKLELSAVKKRIVLLRHGQNYQMDNCDLGLTNLGCKQLMATAEWLADCVAMKRSLIGDPKTWSVAGLGTEDLEIKASLQESLEIVRNVFISRLPLSLGEMVFANNSAVYEPENMFQSGACSDADHCDMHVLISDEYHLLKYFGLCFGIDPVRLKAMRIPHAGFLIININESDDLAWCPSFGMVAHIPPALVCSANQFFCE